MNQIKKHLDMVRVLNNSFVQKIAAYIEAHPENDVTTIQHALQLEQSVTSQHLAKLRACHFVESKRVGKRIQYTMSPNYKQTIAKIIAI
jgi:predicted transcriptional regulator